MNEKTIKTIAIQGGQGSFHEIAAMYYFKNQRINFSFCDDFDILVKSVENKSTEFGLLAIENTVAGSLMGNYALLQSYGVKVCGEILLRIQQNLLATKGVKIEELTEVHSHPIALMQCREFFTKHPKIKLIESVDTALSAERISKLGLNNIGAIASQRAADLFGMNILKSGIESNKRNFTRFLLIKCADSTVDSDIAAPDKASISFTLPHQTGSLSKVLSIFSFYGINLTKIQSIPILGHEWEYRFIVDLIFDDFITYKKSIVAVEPLTNGLKILGEYFRAKEFYQSNQIESNLSVIAFEPINNQ